MEYAAYFRPWAEQDSPGDWAAAREGEGWAAIGVGDHVAVNGHGCLHTFPVLGQMAASTGSIQMFTAFANNLVRSPVEFAQFARTLQALSHGRFEAGLGAGWDEAEMVAAGLAHPPAAERARRFREAILVVRELLRGPCEFDGEFYQIATTEAGPPVDPPPPLFAALGGPWTIRHIGPLVDRIELFANAPAFRRGATDFSALTAITRDDFRRLVHLARKYAPDAKLGAGFFVAVGDRPAVRGMADAFGDGFCQGLAGPPGMVADTLRSFGDDGLDRISVLTPLSGDVETLTPLLIES